MVSALAAFDFYNKEQRADIPEKMLFTACRESDKLDWQSLPVSRNADNIRKEQKTIKDLLTKMTVFSYAYLTYGKKILASSHSEIKDTWYKEYFRFSEREEKDKEKNPRQNPNKDVLDDFEKFLGNFLFWIAAMDDESGKVNFINKKMMIKEELEVGQPFTLFDPEQEITRANISQFLKGEKSGDKDLTSLKKQD